MPTTRRHHAITETPAVQAALDELREELGSDSVDLGELLVLGAREKLARIRAERIDAATVGGRLAERIRRRDIRADQAAAHEVRSTGWARG